MKSLSISLPKAILAYGLIILGVNNLIGSGQAYATWKEQGPGPSLNGGSQQIPGPGGITNPVTGGVNAIVTVPNQDNILYVGTVNGGIWITENATDSNVIWRPLSDNLRNTSSLSINSLELHPTRSNILFAGTGSTSAAGGDGGPGFGILRSENGGTSWVNFPGNAFEGQSINSIAIIPLSAESREDRIFAAVRRGDSPGIFRSNDSGNIFRRISNDGVSGLPNLGVTSIVVDPATSGNTTRLYAGIPKGDNSGEGVWRSNDAGATWSSVLTNSDISNSQRILLAVQENSNNSPNSIYAMVISTAGGLLNVYQSKDTGDTWRALGVPTPALYGSNQGSIHGAIVADPINADILLISGDTSPTPAVIGDFTPGGGGTVFLGNAALLPGNPWQNAVGFGALGAGGLTGGVPHADSRTMVYDNAGNVLHGCDGGIYKIINPNGGATGRSWTSINGSLRCMEFHSIAYDSLNKVVIGGCQDNGTSMQRTSGDPLVPWNETFGGDGGVVAVDNDQVAHANTTIRYQAAQNFGGFNRVTFNNSNTQVGSPFTIPLNIVSGPGAGTDFFTFETPNNQRIQFFQPFVLNKLNPSQMLITTQFIYESFDKGDNLNNLSPASTGSLPGQGQFMNGLVYGGRLNGADAVGMFYVGTQSNDTFPTARVLHRVKVGDPIIALAGYKGSSVRAITVDPANYRNIFVADNNGVVWESKDEGVNFTNITGALRGRTGLSDDIRALAAARYSPTQLIVFAGGLGGVFYLDTSTNDWELLGPAAPERGALPQGLVYDLQYDTKDNVLIAGILGRGAWIYMKGKSVDPFGLSGTWVPAHLADPKAQEY